ncbi:zf-HC2 domain-containing protein [Streptomyces beigongshangae]|uniref:zf-HC2 domain-containing protein n=1 Tax=Streptomyces beigongshangae TaxID=2841597 RepID=UPI001C8636AA|nr:zf-HC2 domain-containing protein [Streptomyces sp. REN17]
MTAPDPSGPDSSDRVPPGPGDRAGRDPHRHDAGPPDDGDGGGRGGRAGPDRARPPRIPTPRSSVEDTGLPLAAPPSPTPSTSAGSAGPPVPAGSVPPPALDHQVLKALLGAWALAACSPAETAAVEDHLGGCGACAEEALRLREAVGLLHRPESLDLDPALRTRVLESCLGRRPPRIPVPSWAMPYDAETARLDALLQDIGDAEWHAPVRLRWFDGDEPTSRRTTVAGVIAHLLTVDGLVAVTLGLDDPLDTAADAPGPAARTEACWRAAPFPPTRSVHGPWREQSHNLVRTAAFATDGGSGRLPVPYGDFELPLRDAMLDRAFETWVHAGDIADAVDYPYEPPAPRHLHAMIDLGARLLPSALAARRRAGLTAPGRTRHLAPAGTPGRSLRLEIEGLGGGEWLIPLDSPAAPASPDHEVAHVALDGVEFCQLAAGHISPEEAAAGQLGDREAIRDVLFAAASLSRI